MTTNTQLSCHCGPVSPGDNVNPCHYIQNLSVCIIVWISLGYFILLSILD